MPLFEIIKPKKNIVYSQKIDTYDLIFFAEKNKLFCFLSNGKINFMHSIDESIGILMKEFINGKEYDTFIKNLIKSKGDEIVKNVNSIINFDFDVEKKLTEYFDTLKQENLGIKQKHISNNKNNIVETKSSYVQKNSETSENNKTLSRFYSKKYNNIPIEIMISILAKNKILEIERIENSGKEKKHYIRIVKADKNAIISAVDNTKLAGITKASKLFGFRDFIGTVKDGIGSFGFIKNLEQVGAFGIPLDNEKEEDLNLYAEKIESIYEEFNILELLNSDDYKDILASSLDVMNNLANITTIEISERVPLLQPSVHDQKWFEFLTEVRKIDSDIVQESFDQKALFTSNYINSYNSFFKGIMAFTLKYPEDINKTYDLYRQVEYAFVLNETKKLKKMHMKNRNKNGMGFILDSDNTKQQKGIVFCEAAIDTMSMKNIFRLSNLVDDNEYKYIGLSSCNNLTSFFEHNFSISLNTTIEKDGSKSYKGFFVDKKEEKGGKLSDEELQKIKNNLNDNDFIFINDGSEASERALYLLQSFLKTVGLDESKIKIENVKSMNDYINYSKYKYTDSSNKKFLVFDYTNVATTIKENDIIIGGTKNNIEFYKRKTKTEYIEINNNNNKSNELILMINRLINEKVGNGKLILAFDNDMAGLGYVDKFKFICELINRDYAVMIPPFFADKNIKFNDENYLNYINDNNDIVKKYKEIIESNNGLPNAVDIAQNFIDSNFVNCLFNDVIEDGYYEKMVEMENTRIEIKKRLTPNDDVKQSQNQNFKKKVK